MPVSTNTPLEQQGLGAGEPEPGESPGNTAYPITPSVDGHDGPATDRIVFGTVALIMFALVAWGGFATESLADWSGGALDWLIGNFGWSLVLASTGFVVFALYLAVSRFGRIPLGRDDEGPEFRTVSWIAMMFSAGMGIGLMFYGVSEPLSHFVSPPPATVPTVPGPDGEAVVAPGATDDAVRTALATSLFHWTLHPWAIYAVAGLAIAYSAFRKGREQLISAVFAPLLGERRAAGPLGKLIDVLALFATLFGSAASLGIGTLQIRTGLSEAGWIDGASTVVLVLIIVVLTVCFIASAVSGIARGIQYLSNINMVLAALLAVFVFLVGPTVFMLNLIPTSLGTYLSDFGLMASRSGATGGSGTQRWLSTWTVFYWAWWISWTPFVGMFIARISRGRTIRQFVGGVLLVPSVVSVIWFAIFGGAAVGLARDGVSVAEGGAETQTFNVLERLPLSTVTSVLVMVLVAIFFVSGADAGSVVMGTLSQRGSIEPRRWVVIFWGAATGAVAAVMLVIGHGGDTALSGIQNLTFIGALPFTVVMVVMCVALVKDLRADPLTLRADKGAEVLERAVVKGHRRHDGNFELEISEDDGERSDGGSAGSPTAGADAAEQDR
ncbi:choline/carnitine/betaine transport [Actinopolyspora xinjiangensis]|uniref:Choline/carnitine/betaine transport n=1 Tax=Actinopolyspora xinjiangensis TaxID=405564 RepID=A0A1H0X107_9ACTN|nr:BCCT family transporter [Actinopolyspora xinjiangensis]SDP96136.1 choline/carnitine/betaine transport [Actinopolyspora xinjiangensis]